MGDIEADPNYDKSMMEIGKIYIQSDCAVYSPKLFNLVHWNVKLCNWTNFFKLLFLGVFNISFDYEYRNVLHTLQNDSICITFAKCQLHLDRLNNVTTKLAS